MCIAMWVASVSYQVTFKFGISRASVSRKWSSLIRYLFHIISPREMLLGGYYLSLKQSNRRHMIKFELVNMSFSQWCKLCPQLYSFLWISRKIWIQNNVRITSMKTQIAKFIGPTWGPSGSCRPKMGPMLAHEPCYQGSHLGIPDLFIISCILHYHLYSSFELRPWMFYLL